MTTKNKKTKITARLEVSDSTYQVFITLDQESDIKIFSGGFCSMDEDLVELGKNFKMLNGVTEGKDILIEKGDLRLLDFVNWFWIDIISSDNKFELEIPKYFEGGKLEVKDRTEEIPVTNEYELLDSGLLGPVKIEFTAKLELE